MKKQESILPAPAMIDVRDAVPGQEKIPVTNFRDQEAANIVAMAGLIY